MHRTSAQPVFRFLSYSVAGIGLASLLLLIPNPGCADNDSSFSAITLAVAISLWFVPGRTVRPVDLRWLRDKI